MKWTLDIGEPQTLPLAGRESVSILLGAGFSVPKGYPTGAKVNDALLNYDKLSVAFSAAGEIMYAKEEGQTPVSPYDNHFQKQFIFCKRLIKEYTKEKGGFDYEEFYDFIRSEEVYQQQYQDLCKDFIDETNEYRTFINGIDLIYNQMVAHLLRDEDGEQWYDEMPSHIGPVDYYDGFLKVLSKWGKEYIVNVHTLNHDLLFESFRKTDYLSGMISDGFDEFGSEYFGVVHIGNASYHVRLERYKGRYNTPIRLYKLHGSLDYVLYRRTVECAMLKPDCYVKIKKYIPSGDLMRGRGCHLGYERYPFAVHGDFLTGTTSKIKHYNEPLLYNKLFKKFRNNLRSAKTLIIIGYGGKDFEINKMIMNDFDYHSKNVYIYDPYPTDSLKLLSTNINAKVIEKPIEYIAEKDLQKVL